MLFDLLMRGNTPIDEGLVLVVENINASIIRHLQRIVRRLGPEHEQSGAFKHARDTRIPAIPDDIENIVASKTAHYLSTRVPDLSEHRDQLVRETNRILPYITARIPTAQAILLAEQISSKITTKLLREAVKKGVSIAPDRAIEHLDPRIPELTVRERQTLDSLVRNCVYDLATLQHKLETETDTKELELAVDTLPNFLALFDFLQEREDTKWHHEAHARAQKMLETTFLEGGLYGGRFNVEKRVYERAF